MFVILEHSSSADVHWDFMLEMAGREGLATWRLPSDPRESDEQTATAINDHPPRFLNYEGPLRCAEGRVRRVDRGEANVTISEPALIVAEVSGSCLRGAVELRHLDGDRWRWSFRPAGGEAGGRSGTAPGDDNRGAT